LADPLPPPPPPGKLRLGCIGWLRRRSLLDSGAILAGWLEAREIAETPPRHIGEAAETPPR